jgi:hypothetical protein
METGMRRLIVLFVALVLCIGSAEAIDSLGVFGGGLSAKIAADTVMGPDTCLAVFKIPNEITSWQFYLWADTFFVAGGDSTATADDSIQVLCRNVKDVNRAYRRSGAVYSPILWLTGQDTFATSEWAVFDGAGTWESADYSDSSFAVGSGNACECIAVTATDDTVLFSLEPAFK